MQEQRGKHQEHLPQLGKFFTKSSINKLWKNESKLLQSCIQSAAQGDKRQQESCADLVSGTEKKKASVLGEMQLGSWWAAKGHSHRHRREEARFQNKNRPAYAVLTWKIKEDDAKDCKRKETFFGQPKRTRKFGSENRIKRSTDSTRVTGLQYIRMLCPHAKKIIIDPRKQGHIATTRASHIQIAEFYKSKYLNNFFQKYWTPRRLGCKRTIEIIIRRASHLLPRSQITCSFDFLNSQIFVCI